MPQKTRIQAQSKTAETRTQAQSKTTETRCTGCGALTTDVFLLEKGQLCGSCLADHEVGHVATGTPWFTLLTTPVVPVLLLLFMGWQIRTAPPDVFEGSMMFAWLILGFGTLFLSTFGTLVMTRERNAALRLVSDPEHASRLPAGVATWGAFLCLGSAVASVILTFLPYSAAGPS